MQVRAGTRPPHAFIDALYPALAALAAFEHAVLALLSVTEAPHPDVLTQVNAQKQIGLVMWLRKSRH